MKLIILINKKKYFFDNPISLINIAKNINLNKYKSYIAGYIDNKLVEMKYIVNKDSKINFIDIEDKKSIDLIRYSCSCIFSYAIKKIWPSINIIICKNTSFGFYCDIESNFSIKKSDFKIIENLIKKLIYKKIQIFKKTLNWKDSYNFFKERNETYKINILNKIKNKSNKFNIYYNKYFSDISNFPIISNISFCKNFKLIKIINLNKKNKFLQRIYIASCKNKTDLNNYISSLKEILKRDHRKINKTLNLYYIREESPGMVFWNKNGFIIFQELKKFIRKKLKNYNYEEVKTPIMMDKCLWKKTGHWNNFSKNMFTTSSENRKFCIKPMNCPGHIQIFKQGLRSYRNLPFRISEFGICHRNEPSGSLHGLMRLKEFTQDDAHIFCTKKQIFNEIKNCIKITYEIYKVFGFKKILVKFSTKPKKYIGEDKIWNRAEKDLKKVLIDNNIKFIHDYENGAFYGPKIEFTLLDCLNRSWQCGTIQLDFFLSMKLKAIYINKKNEKKFPIIIHRAILGSIERFIGILTEEYAGNFPTWLSPIQVILINITSSQVNYVNILKKIISSKGIRVEKDIRNEKIGFKIREYNLYKIPYIVICGKKEMENKTVSVRMRSGKKINNISLIEFINYIKNDIKNKNIYNKEG